MKIKILIFLSVFISVISISNFCYANTEEKISNTVTYNGITVDVPEKSYLTEEEMKTEDGLYERNLPDSLSKIGSAGDEISISDAISKYQNGKAVVGVDVSHHRGTIDWRAVKASGVKFAIIRCGGRGYGEEGRLYADSKFDENIKNAIDNGIYVGIYFFSTARSDEEALQEAAYTVSLIRNYDVKYPVAYDYEEAEGYRNKDLDINQVNSNARTFLSYIKSQGYSGIIYGSSNPLNRKLGPDLKENNDVWVAHYKTERPTYNGIYTMWQFTDNGRVPGINGETDLDIDYKYYDILNRIDIRGDLFNSTYYADKYQDLRNAFGYNEQALRNHYFTCGVREGRSASPIFDPVYYLNKYQDLKNAFGNNYEEAFNHFVIAGINERRQASKYFDVNYYLSNNNDVNRIFYGSETRALDHFAKSGINEGREGSSDFNIYSYYLSQNNYIKGKIGTNYLKYYCLDSGGYPIIDNPIDITNYLFDSNYYADKYQDLKDAFGYDEEALRNHYFTCGVKEGRQASQVFDPIYYVNRYQDLKDAFGDDYEAAFNHFRTAGINEGRQASYRFNVRIYLSNYQDLQDAFGSNYSKALEHYVLSGMSEGRSGTR